MPLLLSYPNIDVNIQDKDGATPLHLAIPAQSQLSAMKSSEALLSAKIALLLTHPKINLEIQDDGGKTALDKLGELPPSFQKMVEHLKNNPEERKALQNNIVEDADTKHMEEQTSDKGNSDQSKTQTELKKEKPINHEENRSRRTLHEAGKQALDE